MRKQFATTSTFFILLLLGLVLVVAAYAQSPEEDNPALDDIAAQGEIGAAGLGDTPPGGLKAYYMFTGVYNEETDPEFATVVHCTNLGADIAADQVWVQFFGEDAGSGVPATAMSGLDANNTQTFVSQAISGWSNVVVAETFGAVLHIQHGSGWVLAPEGSQLICTAQIVGLDAGDNVVDTTRLQLYDDSGNLMGPSPGFGSSGVFLPIILKNG
jgi:hypothetical protein